MIPHNEAGATRKAQKRSTCSLIIIAFWLMCLRVVLVYDAQLADLITLSIYGIVGGLLVISGCVSIV